MMGSDSVAWWNSPDSTLRDSYTARGDARSHHHSYSQDAKRLKGTGSSSSTQRRFQSNKGMGYRRSNTSHRKDKSHALNTNLKPRAKQGCANDPQSIAARHRRERISDRLKVLQELVPNGSKVDLVTMLEKAINYVKFLQLQVKVLMNDDYWTPNQKSEEMKTSATSMS